MSYHYFYSYHSKLNALILLFRSKNTRYFRGQIYCILDHLLFSAFYFFFALLLHGMEDIRCPFPQSVEFYKGLKAAGVETKLVGYPREPHVFREPQHMLDKMKREVAWLDKYVLEVKE